jgi:hypothetical protein
LLNNGKILANFKIKIHVHVAKGQRRSHELQLMNIIVDYNNMAKPSGKTAFKLNDEEFQKSIKKPLVKVMYHH